jgi:hypothetical protein
MVSLEHQVKQSTIGEGKVSAWADKRLRTRSRAPQILLVSRDVELRASVGSALNRSGFEVVRCRGLDHIRYLFRQTQGGESPRLMICEARLLDDAALQILAELRRRRQLPRLVLLRTPGNRALERLASRVDAFAVLDEFDTAAHVAVAREHAPVPGLEERSLRGPPQPSDSTGPRRRA